MWDLIDNREIGVLGTHEDDITTLCLSLDGYTLYSGGYDKVIRMWDLEVGREIGDLGKLDSCVRTLCLSNDGNTLYSGSFDNSIKMWDSNNQFFTFLEKMFFLNTYEIKREEKFRNQILTFRKLNLFSKSSIFIKKLYNPFFFCIENNFPNILKLIIKEKIISYDYDREKIHSPLYHALEKRNNEILKILLDFLKIPENIPLVSNQDLRLMFKSKNPLIHDFLSCILIKIKNFESSNLPIPTVTQFKSINICYNNFRGFYDYNYKEKQKEIKKKPQKQIKTVIYNLQINFNFLKASESSILFLKSYNAVENEDYILSPFKYLIKYKWNKIKKWFILLASIFYFHIFVFSIYIYFPTSIPFLILDLILILLLIIYELIQMISDFKYYIKKPINYLEIILYIIIITTLIINYNYRHHPLLPANNYTESKDINNNISLTIIAFINIICIILNFLRGFLYFQVFDSFIHLINMIQGITYSILTTFFIFFYMSIGFAILFTQTTIEKNNFIDSLKLSFYSMFGELPEIERSDFDYNLWICIIFLGIMMALILSNFLIAIMASKYTELEVKQKIISLHQQAKMILEKELIIKFFSKKKNFDEEVNKKKWFFTIIVPEKHVIETKNDEKEVKLENYEEVIQNEMERFKFEMEDKIENEVKELRKLELEIM